MSDVKDGLSGSIRKPARPSTLRYRALLEELTRIDKHLGEGGDQLQSTAAAVLAVNRFLADDEFVERGNAGKALRLLFDQLGDAYAGSKRTIFIKKIPLGHRPATAMDSHRGMIVFVLDTLIKAKMKNKEAAHFLQKLLKEFNFRYGGKPVTSDLLLTWREQIGDTSPAAATEMMRGLAAHMPVTINSIEEAKTMAKGLVAVIARRISN